MKRHVDVDALYAALESKKSEFGLSWRGLADELGISDHTVFTRMSQGKVPQADALLSLTGWLGVPLEQFATGDVVAPDSRRQTMEAIRTYLRADRSLAPESADAIASVLQAAYDQLAEKEEATAAEASPVAR